MRARHKLSQLLGLWLAIACSSDATSTDGGGGAVAPGGSGGTTGAGGPEDAASAGSGGSSSGGSADGGSAGAGASGAGGAGGSAADAGGGGGTDDAGSVATLSDAHPGDVGMGSDSAVIWFEDFEAGSLAAIAARYDQVRDNGRFTLVTDTASGSGSALAMRAGQGQDAVDLFKQLPDADEWYVRWYARYEAGVPWHHSGMWFGGYHPSMRWPSPNAGNRPSGDDRFSISVEPVYDGPMGKRFDFYNYWMRMHSWMADPVSDDGTAYYGNGMVHENDFTLDEAEWVCLEVHVRLNPDPASGAGAVLEVWKNDVLVRSFGDDGPMGYWIRDKFCPEGADGSECTDYPAPATETLDLQFRNTADLRLNAFWPQNYITDDAMGTLAFDQMVVATVRVGCMR